ncbi:hypothetical protein D3C85_1654600 [compost metagenome]
MVDGEVWKVISRSISFLPNGCAQVAFCAKFFIHNHPTPVYLRVVQVHPDHTIFAE